MIRQARFDSINNAFAMFYQICFGRIPDDLNPNLSLDEAKAAAERYNFCNATLGRGCHDITDETDVAPEPVDVGYIGADLQLSWRTKEGVTLVATLAAGDAHAVVAIGHCLDVNSLLRDRPEFELIGPDRSQEAEELDAFVSELYADHKYYGILNNVEGEIRRVWHATEAEDPNRAGWLLRLRAANGPLIPNSPFFWVDTTEEAKKRLTELVQEQADAGVHYRKWSENEDRATGRI